MILNISTTHKPATDLGYLLHKHPDKFQTLDLSKAFSSAMNGKCKDKPELVDVKLPFEVTIAVIPAPKGGEILIRKFFEPLGYKVELIRHQLDSKFPEWGDSKYYTLKLNHTI